jgi:plastocyanin
MKRVTNFAAILGALLAFSGSPSPAQAPVPAAHGVSNHRLQIINMDIDFRPHARPSQGRLSGYDPVVAVVHAGDRVQFVNTDDIRHTATGYSFGGRRSPKTIVLPAIHRYRTVRSSAIANGALETFPRTDDRKYSIPGRSERSTTRAPIIKLAICGARSSSSLKAVRFALRARSFGGHAKCGSPRW